MVVGDMNRLNFYSSVPCNGGGGYESSEITSYAAEQFPAGRPPSYSSVPASFAPAVLTPPYLCSPCFRSHGDGKETNIVPTPSESLMPRPDSTTSEHLASHVTWMRAFQLIRFWCRYFFAVAWFCGIVTLMSFSP